VHPLHYAGPEALLSMVLAIMLFVTPASAAMRFQERSLYMNSTEPGDTTSYTISFQYMSALSVGSVDMLFCVDPIPYHPCVTPPGLDVSDSELIEQTGETNFSIATKSANHLILSRPQQMVTSNTPSSYTLANVKNPTQGNISFSVRLRSHASQNATGPQIDFGSVKGQVQTGVVIQTQVPPMLIFCLAQEVDYNCTGTNDTYFSNMGELSPTSTLTARSQMAVGTNASGGFAITANGGSVSAGTNVIDGAVIPSESIPGTNQFGINLVANDTPVVGDNPEGEWANAVTSPDYSLPNKYKFVDGDVVAYSPSVSLMKKFTVSYILNSEPELAPGVYSTTINYIASGRF
jgi:hypothetical protein